MLLSELAGILEGSATVYLPDAGYCVSNEDVAELIAFYGDREVLSIRGNCNGSEVFAEQDVLLAGVLEIELGERWG